VKILVVEDDFLTRETIREALEFEGYDVVTAEDGEDGLEKLEKDLPRVILLDMHMPKMGGVEFLDHVARDPALRAIPIIAVTAHIDPEIVARVRETLKKPLDLDRLIERVGNVARAP
jgi:CheY-like chemotaxis protein